ncbi:MAG: hypothetical protein GY797_04255 [Deltaproteobacteria bacterium]|nr:hypothetical protein [Deltaproteobacteria bacterium]
MEIQQQSEDKLVLKAGLLDIIPLSNILWGYVLLTVFLIPYIVEYSRLGNILLTFDLGLIIIFWIASLGLLLVKAFGVEKEYSFDKVLKKLVVKTQIFHWSLNKEYSLESVKTVFLKSNNNGLNILRLKTFMGKDISLNTCIFELAEQVSQFLELPLQFKLGEEKVIRFPKQTTIREPGIFALNCSQCGGQLPVVKIQETHVICEFCQTASRLEWK